MVTVGRTYQVVLEQAAGEKQGIRPGSMAARTEVGDQLAMRFLPPEHDRSLASTLLGKRNTSVLGADKNLAASTLLVC